MTRKVDHYFKMKGSEGLSSWEKWFQFGTVTKNNKKQQLIWNKFEKKNKKREESHSECWAKVRKNKSVAESISTVRQKLFSRVVNRRKGDSMIMVLMDFKLPTAPNTYLYSFSSVSNRLWILFLFLFCNLCSSHNERAIPFQNICCQDTVLGYTAFSIQMCHLSPTSASLYLRNTPKETLQNKLDRPRSTCQQDNELDTKWAF